MVDIVNKEIQSEEADRLLLHYKKLGLFFVFDEDPEHEEIEAEKQLVISESQASQLKNAERMNAQIEKSESSSSASDEEPAKWFSIINYGVHFNQT